MEIIKTGSKAKERATEVVTAAFFDYPMFSFLFPDPKRRTRLLHGTWESVDCALRYEK